MKIDNKLNFYMKNDMTMAIVVDMSKGNLIVTELRTSEFAINVSSTEGRQTNMVKTLDDYRDSRVTV